MERWCSHSEPESVGVHPGRISAPLPRRANGATKRQLRRARWVQLYLPLAFLAGVAARHHWLVRGEALTAWKGGGFGMFSTVDAGGNRPVRIELRDTKGRRWRASPPSDLKPMLRLIKQLPSKRLLNEFAALLAKRVWLPPDYGSAGGTQRLPGMADVWSYQASQLTDLEAAEAGFESAVVRLPTQIPFQSARAWEEAMGIPRRVIEVEELVLSIQRETFDDATGRMAFELIDEVTAPAIGAEEIHEQLGDHRDLVDIE